jgi:hypothetical protein
MIPKTMSQDNAMRPVHPHQRSDRGFSGRWPTDPPADAPFEASTLSAALTGRYANYTNADTWYPSWASDGHLYSPWTDGYILRDSPSTYQDFEDAHPDHACNSVHWQGRVPATAQARIVGDDPQALRIEDLPPRIDAMPWPTMEEGKAKFHGRYPCGSLVHEGVWYYGTYLLDNKPGVDCGGVGWTMLGPCVGFRTSTDFGQTWTECPNPPDRPLFPEDPRRAPVKIGSPHFVDFGQNMRHSPDGYAYLTAHGSRDPHAWNTWIQGDCVFLLRVKPSIANLNNLESYEFFAGHDSAGRAIWSNRFTDIQPLIDWPGRLGCVTATYFPGLKKYVMCITRGAGRLHHDSMLLMADQLTGPWSIATWLGQFGHEAYFLNIPSKFISEDGKCFWLCYSANWSDKNAPGHPEGSHYSLSLREFAFA